MEPRTEFADFQNAALATRGELGKRLEHEDAAHQKRNWVRLSYDCNNRCTFCLDSNAHDGTMRGNFDIKAQIIEGRKRGAERLILSGGEPTMHPNFLDFVTLGKKAGYPKVQTVTNGRMFKYPDFLERAAKNGLDEITFSLHGHTAKLHDALVGTPGAFADETAGLKAALASGAFIINIDIVINKKNVRHLPTMLETFIGWGVKEFDLLHIIPFGNAWTEARDDLFYDLEGNLEHLQKTFAYARRPDIHIWLNRFPPPYAEGFEDLVQDPYKLNDEVRGRREEYDRYLSLGEKLSCREQDRCNRCYLQNLCDTLDDVIAARKREEVEVLRVASGALPRAGRMPKASDVRLVAATVADAAKLLAEVKAFYAEGTAPTEVQLELADYTGIATAIDAEGRFEGQPVRRCYTADPAAAASLFALPRSFEVGLYLTPATATFARTLDAATAAARLVLVQRNYDLASDALSNDIDLPAFFRDAPAALALENIPACLSGREPRKAPVLLDSEMLGSDARIDMKAYTKRYVADGYYTKALRCSTCSLNASCRGVHVNWVRAHGFAALSPVNPTRTLRTADDSDVDDADADVDATVAAE